MQRDGPSALNWKTRKAVWFLSGLILIAITASAWVLMHQKASHHFVANFVSRTNTNPEQELDQILQKKNADVDLALINWLMVAPIPEFHDLAREDYFGQLDEITGEVKKKMAKMEADGWPSANSDDSQTRCRRFCSAIIALHFDYADQFREENLTPLQMKDLYANPDNLFLAGLLRTKHGTCVSLPMLYLVLGQRLKMPVHLVEIGKHYFIRWEDSQFRMNIETTNTKKIAWASDDSVYLDSEKMTSDQLRGSDLRNLTSREVVGELFFTRTSYWHDHGSDFEGRSRADLTRAHELSPDDPSVENTYVGVFRGFRIVPQKSSHSSP
jgi:hypothetical protein